MPCWALVLPLTILVVDAVKSSKISPVISVVQWHMRTRSWWSWSVVMEFTTNGDLVTEMEIYEHPVEVVLNVH